MEPLTVFLWDAQSAVLVHSFRLHSRREEERIDGMPGPLLPLVGLTLHSYTRNNNIASAVVYREVGDGRCVLTRELPRAS